MAHPREDVREPVVSRPVAGVGPTPEPRGPISEWVLGMLRAGPPSHVRRVLPPETAISEASDPFGEDLQLTLYLCYELHYRGLVGVDARWEWDPDLLTLRAAAERAFLDGLRSRVRGGEDVSTEVARLLAGAEEGGVSDYLAQQGSWWQLREFLVQRSVYHLKEADPHAWAIPRLRGRAKAGLVAVEFDEFGAGRAEDVHQQLYADALAGAGLDDGYLAYLEHAPAPALAVVNMMSLFGLHRSLRGALVGHFASVEMTSSPVCRRMVTALERLGAAPACVHFYREHVAADAVHEQVMRHDVLDGLLADEPALASDVVFGIQATDVVEDHFTAHALAAWEAGVSSLRRGLPD